MSRARNIKPGFFKSDQLAECGPLARILFIGLWCEADREGRLEDRAKRLKAAILPYDNCDVDSLLSELAAQKLILRYEFDGGKFISIPTFCAHQNPHHMEAPSVIPPPEGFSNKYNHTPISPKQRARIYARDNNACVFCGASEDLQIDHVVLVAHGGSSDDDNLRTLCAQCNNKRSKTRKASDKPELNRADSLIPDSLIPDSNTEPEPPTAAVPPLPAQAIAEPVPAKPEADPIFGTGLDLLKRKGVPEKSARSFLGLLRKEVRDDLTVAELLTEADRADVSDPCAWLRAAVKSRRSQGPPRTAPMGKQMTGMLALLELANGRVDSTGNRDGAGETLLLEPRR